MKFQLEPDNRNAPDATLLDDLRKVARSLGKDFVTMPEYKKHGGRFHFSTIQKRFGSWSKAHESAGLNRILNYNTTPKQSIASLQRVAAKLGKTTITTIEYLANGGYSLKILHRHFGSWKNALKQAGLAVSHLYHERSKDEQLFENIEQLWESLGRQPKYNDFSEPPSRFSYDNYRKRFGSLRKALEAFVAASENQQEQPEDSPPEKIPDTLPTSTTSKHKTSRTISWRMRFLVMRRDNFKCCIDGYSPATHPGTILEVDHIKSWDSGGETVLENLQTLCQRCNGGKSNLPMKEGV